MPDQVSRLSRRRENNQRRRFGRLLAVPFLCVGTMVFSSGGASGTEPVITRIEEDWVLVVSNPSLAKAAPQLLNVISPVSNLSGTHAVLEINHNTQPEFSAGGLQIQAWNGETLVGHQRGLSVGSLRFENETLRYTLAMEIRDGKVTVEVINGQSDTWGQFGGQGDLKTQLVCPISDLSQYSPQFSAAQSRVGYGGPRVTSFYLDRARFFAGSTLIRQDSTDRHSAGDSAE